jgi:hypothetical protein
VAAPALKEHRWIVIVQLADAPHTDVVEQCGDCGVVRHTSQHAWYDAPLGGIRSRGVVRYYRKGLPALPSEDCP